MSGERSTKTEKAKTKRVTLENAADVPPPSGTPTCVTIGGIDEVLKGRTMDEFIAEADAKGARERKDTE